MGSHARNDGFSALSLDELASRSGGRAERMAAPMRQTMADPQQARFERSELAPLVGAGIAPGARGMVEPAVLQRMERPTPPAMLRDEARFATDVVSQARAEADRLVAEARSTARAMLAQAREVIAGEREDAVRRGFEEGRAAGVAEADAEMSGLVQTCEHIALEVMHERERILAEHEPDLVELAMAIAARIVNAELAVEPDLVVDVCRGAMRKAFQRDNLQVLAHPDDLERLRAAGPLLAQQLGGVEHLDFVEERRVDPGSVIVRTPAGEIDGTVAGKSARIELALREGIEQRRAARRTADA